MIKESGIEIPELEYLYNNGYFINIYTGSKNGFNYKIIPDREKDITVLIWEGIYSCDNSDIKKEEHFELNEDGHKKMVDFILNQLKEYEEK